MIERPIIMSGPMVRAILAGRKTQTRRVLKGDWWVKDDGTIVPPMRSKVPTPFGEVGGKLWTREAWALIELLAEGWDSVGVEEEGARRYSAAVRYRADQQYGKCTLTNEQHDSACERLTKRGAVWRSPIHMPKWAARLWLEVLAVRVERLHAIDELGARAEGVTPFHERFPDMPEQRLTTGELAFDEPYRAAFAVLWDELNADRGYPWVSNPWVWVVEFRRIKP